MSLVSDVAMMMTIKCGSFYYVHDDDYTVMMNDDIECNSGAMMNMMMNLFIFIRWRLQCLSINAMHQPAPPAPPAALRSCRDMTHPS